MRPSRARQYLTTIGRMCWSKDSIAAGCPRTARLVRSRRLVPSATPAPPANRASGHAPLAGLPSGHALLAGLASGHVPLAGLPSGHALLAGLASGHALLAGLASGHVPLRPALSRPSVPSRASISCFSAASPAPLSCFSAPSAGSAAPDDDSRHPSPPTARMMHPSVTNE